MEKLQEYVDDINENIRKLETRGPVSKYVLPDENLRGRSVISLPPDFSMSLLFLKLWLNSYQKLFCIFFFFFIRDFSA